MATKKKTQTKKEKVPEALQYHGHSYVEVEALTRELEKYGKHLIMSFSDAAYETLQSAVDESGQDVDVRTNKALIDAQSKNIELTIQAVISFINDAMKRTLVEDNKVE